MAGCGLLSPLEGGGSQGLMHVCRALAPERHLTLSYERQGDGRGVPSLLGSFEFWFCFYSRRHEVWPKEPERDLCFLQRLKLASETEISN